MNPARLSKILHGHAELSADTDSLSGLRWPRHRIPGLRLQRWPGSRGHQVRPVMKRRSVMLVLLGVAVLSPYVQAQESYPMLCRGGGVMRYDISPRQDGQVLRIYFAKGTKAAGVAAIPLGTCTWTDRGIRPEEPNVIFVKQLGAYIDAKLGAAATVARRLLVC